FTLLPEKHSRLIGFCLSIIRQYPKLRALSRIITLREGVRHVGTQGPDNCRFFWSAARGSRHAGPLGVRPRSALVAPPAGTWVAGRADGSFRAGSPSFCAHHPPWETAGRYRLQPQPARSASP